MSFQIVVNNYSKTIKLLFFKLLQDYDSFDTQYHKNRVQVPNNVNQRITENFKNVGSVISIGTIRIISSKKFKEKTSFIQTCFPQLSILKKSYFQRTVEFCEFIFFKKTMFLDNIIWIHAAELEFLIEIVPVFDVT